MIKLLFVFLLMISAISARAARGPHTIGNGGDPLEIRFKEIAANIGEWIANGGADRMKMPAGLRLAKYKEAMASALTDYAIEITDQPVLVGGSEKTCVNFPNGAGGEIRCNRARFRETAEKSPDDLYRLVHHELAGLSGLELSRGAESDYQLSAQLSAFLSNEVVRRLPVATSKARDFRCDVDARYMGKIEKTRLRPISSFETYMLEGSILNLRFFAYLWEIRAGFDLQVSKTPYLLGVRAPADLETIAPGDATMIFRSGPSFESIGESSSKGIAGAYFVHFLEPALLSPGGASVEVNVSCTY